MRSTALAAFVLLLLASGVWAQDPQQKEDEHYTEFEHEIKWPEFPEPAPGAPDAKLAIYFDLVGRTRSRAVAANEPFEFYLVAQEPHVAVIAWEAKVSADAPLAIVEEDLGGINVGSGGEYRVAYQPMDCRAGVQVVLAKFRGILLEEGHSDLVIHLAPVSKSTIKDPDRPGYVVCREPIEARPFAYEDIAAVVNPERIQLRDERPGADLFRPDKGGKDRSP